MSRLQALWITLRSSLWFTPALIVCASLILAAALVDMQGRLSDELAKEWPRLLGASAEGSRQMLNAIATSMITVAGVVFSITVVALSLASSQYSPRILRNFMRDRVTQLVLGVFVGIFAYCLVVLRTIRGSDEFSFIPSIAVVGAMVYVLVAIGFLIYFIHHVADSIQASAIITAIAQETRGALDKLFPEDVGHPAHGDAFGPGPVPSDWLPVIAMRSGYVLGIDGEKFLKFAVKNERVVRLPANGSFATEGTPLLELSGFQLPSKEDQDRLRSWVTLGRQRTVEQDAAFGFQQLVDMALRALSPGINDPTTASMCVDSLRALLTRLATRRMPDPLRSHEGRLRVIAPAAGFGELAQLAYGAIVRHSRGDIQVLGRVLDALEVIGSVTVDSERRGDLSELSREIYRELGKPDWTPKVADLRGRAQQLAQAFGT